MTGSQETVFLQGHIIDSLILAKVLDTILMMGGSFDLQDVNIGATREAASKARIVVQAPSSRVLGEILRAIQPHGATIEREADCRFEPAPSRGVFPEEFYATTHLPTQIRLDGEWVNVENMEMDLGICVDPAKARARTVPMGAVTAGDLIVIGRDGIRVTPLVRPAERDVFGFMESVVSSERPHQPVIADIAKRMQKLREWHREGRAGAKVLLAGGPAIVHAGGRDALAWLIEAGYIQLLFCGNALAAHDMEAGLYGTSLGYGLAAGRSVPHGHEHHLRTINRIRAIGSIQDGRAVGVHNRWNHGGVRAAWGDNGHGGYHSRRRSAARCGDGLDAGPAGHAGGNLRSRPRAAGGVHAPCDCHGQFATGRHPHRLR